MTLSYMAKMSWPFIALNGGHPPPLVDADDPQDELEVLLDAD